MDNQNAGFGYLGMVDDITERRLAEDWGDVDLLAAHRATRDELQGLLERWETLFESAQQV